MDDVSNPPFLSPDDSETRFSDTEQSVAEFSSNETKLNKASTEPVLSESGASSINRTLSSYEIGAKMRQLRLRKKIALVDLGKHTGLSASMLSQLETGKLVPTLATLVRIAMVFDVGLDHFFSDVKRRRTFIVVRAAERVRFPDNAGSSNPSYFFECLAFSAHEKSLQAYIAEFPNLDNESPEHFHEGAEFIHILQGSLRISYAQEHHLLQAGDSVYFDSSESHSYRGMSSAPARALVVTTPPRL